MAYKDMFTMALVYPPGIGIVVPGERWDEHAARARELITQAARLKRAGRPGG